jgi:hypothetical protein
MHATMRLSLCTLGCFINRQFTGTSFLAISTRSNVLTCGRMQSRWPVAQNARGTDLDYRPARANLIPSAKEGDVHGA